MPKHSKFNVLNQVDFAVASYGINFEAYIGEVA